MSETIIAGIITGAVSIITTLISAKSSREKMTHELDKRLAVTDNEIAHVKADVKEHNGYAKMFAAYSAASEEKFKTVFNDIAEMKADIKDIKKGA
ncbi:MAG: hypothetical protein IKR26_03395 [Lachnospiraceae bacterium]|nr:hypothetical protein [Lachnospiraceae bacterium]